MSRTIQGLMNIASSNGTNALNHVLKPIRTYAVSLHDKIFYPSVMPPPRRFAPAPSGAACAFCPVRLSLRCQAPGQRCIVVPQLEQADYALVIEESHNTGKLRQMSSIVVRTRRGAVRPALRRPQWSPGKPSWHTGVSCAFAIRVYSALALLHANYPLGKPFGRFYAPRRPPRYQSGRREGPQDTWVWLEFWVMEENTILTAYIIGASRIPLHSRKLCRVGAHAERALMLCGPRL